MNNSQTFGIRFLCTLALIIVFNPMLYGQQDTNSITEDVVIREPNYVARISKDAFIITMTRGDETVFQTGGPQDAAMNLDFVKDGKPQHVSKLKNVEKNGDTYVLNYATTHKEVDARVELRAEENVLHVKSWILYSASSPLPSAAIRLDPSGQWFGGGFQGWREQLVLPINDARIAKKWFLADGNTQGTPFWYSTKGIAVWIRTPYDFYYSVNADANGRPDGLLRLEIPLASELQYDILLAPDVRQVLQRIVKEIGYPKTTPPAEYFKMPIYTTWVEHKTGVSQQKVLEYAHAIHNNNLPCGVIEIDDRWETRYGDMQFDAVKFPDPRAMVTELHRLGYKVTLWVHPFVNPDSQTFQQHQDDGWLMHDRSGKLMLTRWWNGPATIWDITNPQAAAEFRRRLHSLQTQYGLDGFKFDGADVDFMTTDAVPFQNITNAQYADIYNAEATSQFTYNETRVGVYSQPLGIVQRLIDKHSVWTNSNGLLSLIPEATLSSMRGFQYLMPDMVGGNQYDNDVIDKELIIRWSQASALMPLLQFSWGPWHFDQEAVDRARDASQLHIEFAPYVYELATRARTTGEPILAPLWYHAPLDANTYKIVDEYMVGGDVVVAPVLIKGATSRDIYLPEGNWRDYNSGQLQKGGAWLRNYGAPLDKLPLFVRDGSPAMHQVKIKNSAQP
ncbi:MAG TPA: glycoside hydrolase family 31 protein [Terriglobales bacterium]|nr:glycoside hydrolase family 31 protein [Terriglobales bacterium]